MGNTDLYDMNECSKLGDICICTGPRRNFREVFFSNSGLSKVNGYIWIFSVFFTSYDLIISIYETVYNYLAISSNIYYKSQNKWTMLVLWNRNFKNDQQKITPYFPNEMSTWFYKKEIDQQIISPYFSNKMSTLLINAYMFDARVEKTRPKWFL